LGIIDVMIQFEEMLAKIAGYNPEADLGLLRTAYDFALQSHQGQRRKSGEPFIVHPLEVANILADLKLDTITICSGLLHDVVEDTKISRNDLADRFGEEVAHIVEGVTKISQITFASKQAKQAENFRKMLLAMVDDIRVILVKLADRLHNMRTLGFMTSEQQLLISRETLDIYAPIANRLGMGKIRCELEDLAFSFLEPKIYEDIQGQIDKKRTANESFSHEIKKIIERHLKENNIKAEIQSRIKRIFSIYQKLLRQQISFDQVYDLIAIRIITESVQDCYAILGIVHNIWTPVPGRIKDFVGLPRQNMYQSLHTSVFHNGQPFEIQIRTYEMHSIAEEGIAAHWKYKEGRLGRRDKDDQRFLWLRHLLDWQREVKDPHLFLNNLKIDLYPDEVYVFTPKGDVITLPRDATPVDFAYAIHSQVGHLCKGAKVGGRLVDLRYKLKNGDICEIITSKDQTPSRDWLSIVKTSRARNRIRHWLNEVEKQRSIDVGRKILEREARRFHVSVKETTNEKNLERLYKDYGVQKYEDLISGIGFGKISARQIIQRLFPEKVTAAEDASGKSPKESMLSSMVKKVFQRSDTPILVKGHSDMLVYLAKCCNPIRGEEIIGFISQGKGIAVHSVNCPNIEQLFSNPDRQIEVKWTSSTQTDGSTYPEKLAVLCEDRRGTIADITTVIAGTDANIRDINAISTDDNHGVVNLTVEVKDIQHLSRIIQGIKQLRGVLQINRRRQQAR
jgi:GTP diphosphokinase / guanosine-3',5'-bis(diphosphate) 3'-diphosphatase